MPHISEKNTKTFLIGGILVLLQFSAIQIIKFYPHWIESIYSRGIYPIIKYILDFICSAIPFSIGDILYIIIAVFFIYILNSVFKKKINLGTFLSKGLIYANIIYFLFHFNWGLNYYRIPLNENLQIDNAYTTDKLIEKTNFLLNKTNLIHQRLQENDSLKIKIPYSQEVLQQHIDSAYTHLQQKITLPLYPKNNNAKSSIISTGLNYMGFGGYLNPFTLEAQVNKHLPAYKMPVTFAHEKAHQSGFSKENEANFIGALVCMESTDPYLQYAGYSFALRYCLNDLYTQNEAKASWLHKQIRPGVLKNYKEVSDFWENHETPLNYIMEIIYDNFLKVNNQESGIETYNYVVALLVNYPQNS